MGSYLRLRGSGSAVLVLAILTACEPAWSAGGSTEDQPAIGAKVRAWRDQVGDARAGVRRSTSRMRKRHELERDNRANPADLAAAECYLDLVRLASNTLQNRTVEKVRTPLQVSSTLVTRNAEGKATKVQVTAHTQSGAGLSATVTADDYRKQLQEANKALADLRKPPESLLTRQKEQLQPLLAMQVQLDEAGSALGALEGLLAQTPGDGARLSAEAAKCEKQVGETLGRAVQVLSACQGFAPVGYSLNGSLYLAVVDMPALPFAEGPAKPGDKAGPPPDGLRRLVVRPQRFSLTCDGKAAGPGREIALWQAGSEPGAFARDGQVGGFEQLPDTIRVVIGWSGSPRMEQAADEQAPQPAGPICICLDDSLPVQVPATRLALPGMSTDPGAVARPAAARPGATPPGAAGSRRPARAERGPVRPR